jgi:hypothetical protein
MVLHQEVESDILGTLARNISKSKVQTDLLGFAMSNAARCGLSICLTTILYACQQDVGLRLKCATCFACQAGRSGAIQLLSL